MTVISSCSRSNYGFQKYSKRWVSEGGKATLVAAPEADISLEAIKEFRTKTRAGAATFLVKVKRIEENLQMKKPTSKQTRLFQAKMFSRNGTTGQIKQSSHGRSLHGKKVRWAMKIENQHGTAGCGRRLDEDQQKRRCVNTGIVWQELGNRSANEEDESM